MSPKKFQCSGKQCSLTISFNAPNVATITDDGTNKEIANSVCGTRHLELIQGRKMRISLLHEHKCAADKWKDEVIQICNAEIDTKEYHTKLEDLLNEQCLEPCPCVECIYKNQENEYSTASNTSVEYTSGETIEKPNNEKQSVKQPYRMCMCEEIAPSQQVDLKLNSESSFDSLIDYGTQFFENRPNREFTESTRMKPTKHRECAAILNDVVSKTTQVCNASVNSKSTTCKPNTIVKGVGCEPNTCAKEVVCNLTGTKVTDTCVFDRATHK